MVPSAIAEHEAMTIRCVGVLLPTLLKAELPRIYRSDVSQGTDQWECSNLQCSGLRGLVWLSALPSQASSILFKPSEVPSKQGTRWLAQGSDSERVDTKLTMTEGYPCVHSRAISLQTVRLYSMSQCGQYRYEFTYEFYENHESQYSILFRYQYSCHFCFVITFGVLGSGWNSRMRSNIKASMPSPLRGIFNQASQECPEVNFQQDSNGNNQSGRFS